jgi:hypothetical protein
MVTNAGIEAFEGLTIRSDFDDGDGRVRDVDVGKMLGMARPEDIRRTIAKYAEDLNDFGILARRAIIHEGAGRRASEYWLNKDQALFICGRSDTELGRKTYKLLVKAFGAFLRGAAAVNVPPILQADFRPWEKTWQDEIARLLCDLNGSVFTGRQPRWVGKHYGEIYECLLGKDAYAELKARNPKPAKGHNHHSLIADHLIDRFRAQLSVVEALLRCSDSLADFRANLRRNFKGAPLQLPLAGMRSLPRGDA